MNPKIEILIDIYVFCFVYILFSIYILGYDVSFISSKVAKVILIFPIILVIIDSLYSKHIDVRKQQDGTIVYGVSYNDNENSIADVLEDMKKLAESTDNAIEKAKYKALLPLIVDRFDKSTDVKLVQL